MRYRKRRSFKRRPMRRRATKRPMRRRIGYRL